MEFSHFSIFLRKFSHDLGVEVSMLVRIFNMRREKPFSHEINIVIPDLVENLEITILFTDRTIIRNIDEFWNLQ